MIRTFILVAALLPGFLHAQELVGKSRTDIKNHASSYGTGIKIAETDSTISWEAGKNGTEADYFYLLDSAGKCRLEKISTASGDYYREILKTILKKGKYHWKNINLNQYVSKFSKNLLLELQEIKNVFSISLIKTNMDKTMYRMLMGKK